VQYECGHDKWPCENYKLGLKKETLALAPQWKVKIHNFMEFYLVILISEKC
jgi:hypothetical protein